MKNLVWVLFALLISVLPAIANRGHMFNPSGESLKDALEKGWDCSTKLEPDKFVALTVGVGVDGRLYNVRIIHYCSNDQFNAECLEAVCGSSPVTGTQNHSGNLLDYDLYFEKDGFFKPRFDGKDIRDYLSEHPQPADPHLRFVVIHKIPLDVLRRFPGLYSEEELVSPKNLMQVRIDTGLPGPQDGPRPYQLPVN
jgi:hypothetical protein